MSKIVHTLYVGKYRLDVVDQGNGIDLCINGQEVVGLDLFYLDPELPEEENAHSGPCVILFGDKDADPLGHLYYEGDGRVEACLDLVKREDVKIGSTWTDVKLQSIDSPWSYRPQGGRV